MPAAISLSRFEAALFDIDGTLLDSLEPLVRGLSDAYEHFGADRPSDEQILSTLGTPLRVQLTMFGLSQPTPEELLHRVDWTIDRFEHYAYLESEFEPAIRALEAAHSKGLKIALVTSKNSRELEHLLARFPSAKWAHALVCSSDVAKPKPHGECALLACEKLGVAPHTTVLIGDSVFDIHCARDAGTASVAVAYGATPEPELAAANPDALFRTPEELLAWAQEDDLTPHGKKELSSLVT